MYSTYTKGCRHALQASLLAQWHSIRVGNMTDPSGAMNIDVKLARFAVYIHLTGALTEEWHPSFSTCEAKFISTDCLLATVTKLICVIEQAPAVLLPSIILLLRFITINNSASVAVTETANNLPSLMLLSITGYQQENILTSFSHVNVS